MNLNEAARRAGRSYRHMLRYVYSGELEATKDDQGRWIVTEAALLAFLEKHNTTRNLEPFEIIERATNGRVSRFLMQYLYSRLREHDAGLEFEVDEWRASVTALMEWLADNPWHPEAGKHVDAVLAAVPDLTWVAMTTDMHIINSHRGKK